MSNHPSALKIVSYFWAASIAVIVLFYGTKLLFNWDNIYGADFYILILAPYLVSILLKKKLNLPLDEALANKVANYFIIIFLILFYLIIFIFIAALDDVQREKLAEFTTFIIISFSVMSVAIFVFGRWIIVMNLTHKKNKNL